MILQIEPAKSLHGEFRPPSDKSITHRAMMLAAASTGRCIIRHPLLGEDCQATLRCLQQMGLKVEDTGQNELWLDPAPAWNSPSDPLDCGNSGTTMRLLSGLIASRPIEATLIGDASLSNRPMERIATPLRLMGANLEGDRPPIRIRGTELKGIHYQSPVASAQIKSCVLFAGLKAGGITIVTEPHLSRDHTERMFEALGVELHRADAGRTVSVLGDFELPPFEISIPGDLSSASFFLIAAAIFPGSRLTIKDCGMNPTRTGILDVLSRANAEVEVRLSGIELGEPVADLSVSGKPALSSFEIAGELVPRLLDEIPVLAVLATRCEGVSTIRGAAELRVKESDRIEAVAVGLRAMGAQVETFDDGLAISGPVKLKGARIEAKGDHRIAMAFAVAGLVADGATEIEGSEAIQTSFPEFESEMRRLTTA